MNKDTIYRQAAIDAFNTHYDDEYFNFYTSLKILEALPSAQPEYFDYTDIDEVWEYYAKENDANLTDNAKQIKDAMWVGYRIGLKSAQPEIIYCRECKFASGDSRICMKSGYSPIGELDFCAWAERRAE